MYILASQGTYIIYVQYISFSMYTSVIFISHFYPIYGSVKVYIFLSKYSLYFLALTGSLYIMLCFFRSSNSKLLKTFTQFNATVSTSMSMQRGQPMQQTKSNAVKVPRKKFQKYKNKYQVPKNKHQPPRKE